VNADTVSPFGLTLQDWADSTVGLLATTNLPPPRLDDDDWQNWAARLLQVLPQYNGLAPDPYAFDDWREWAVYFNDAL